MRTSVSRMSLTATLVALGLVAGCEQGNDAPEPATEAPVSQVPAPEDPAAGAYEALTDGSAAAGGTAKDPAAEEMTAASEPEATATRAVATLEPKSDSSVSGTATFTASDDQDGVVVDLQLSGLSAGTHGFHIHETGDCSAPDASSAGGHYNPENVDHGAPGDGVHHVGDMGNITAGEDGSVSTRLTFDHLSLSGDNAIVGKAVIVHGGEDDLTSQPSGAAGPRIACGVIEMAASTAADGEEAGEVENGAAAGTEERPAESDDTAPPAGESE